MASEASWRERHPAAIRGWKTFSAVALTAAAVLTVMAGEAFAQASAARDVDFSSAGERYSAVLYLPEGTEPFPTVIFNHDGDAGPEAFAQLGPVFSQRGWAFFAPYRPGSGADAVSAAAERIAEARAAGARAALPTIAGLVAVALLLFVALTRRRAVWLRAAGTAAALAIGPIGYYAAGESAEAAARIEHLEAERLSDHLAAADWLEGQRFADPNRIATAGHSDGGIVSLLAAEERDYCAAVDAGGAARTWGASTDLRRRLAQAARSSRAPVLFFQAENDYSTEPSRILSREVENGGEYSERIVYPAFGGSAEEGHAFASRGSDVWADDVLDFLGRFCGADLVRKQGPFLLYSAFWMNLHHVLYAESWRQKTAPTRPRPQFAPGPGRRGVLSALLTEPLEADLAAEERSVWNEAVDHYDRFLSNRDLLFGLAATRQALVRAGSAPPQYLPDQRHLDVLLAAAPVYRKYWWPAHDAANRAWIADVTRRIESLSPEVPERLVRLYETSWFDEEVRVDVVRVADVAGAYTAFEPAPAHITISSGEPNHRDWNAAEILFQEASHGLEARFRRVFYQSGTFERFAGTIHHAVLFYLTGEVVREALAARGVAHEPYLYSTGLLDERWPDLREPLRAHWRPYLDAETTLSEAAAAFAAAVADDR